MNNERGGARKWLPRVSLITCGFALTSTALTGANAQLAPPPAGLNIQQPGPRVFALVGVSLRNDYRDRILSREPVATISGGVAYRGFALSAWRADEFQSSGSMSEVLLGYSYKLPAVDVHIGYVLCSNERMPGGCPDAIRASATTNFIPHTTLEASVDVPINSDRRTWSASLVHNLVRRSDSTLAVRTGWTTTDYGSAALGGVSVRAIAAKRLSRTFEMNASIGHSWTYGRARPASAQDGFVGSLSWAVRF